MKNSYLFILALAAATISSNASALTLEEEKVLSGIARDRCAGEFVEGKDFEIIAQGEGKVEIRLIGKKYAGLNGKFVTSLTTWEGIRKVRPEDQAGENLSFRDCVRSELAALRAAHND